MRRIHQRISLGLLIIILWTATALRLWSLTEFPPGITGDEAQNALDIIGLLTHPRLTVFFPANTGREALFFYLAAIPFAILGPTLFALRLLPALAGILLVALSYRWLKELLPRSGATRRVALLAALFIATAPWGLYNSRLGLRGSLLPAVMLAAYLYFWRGYCHRQKRWFAVAGLFLGLSAHTYTSSRLLPLIFILFAVGLTLFFRRQDATQIVATWQGVALTGAVALLAFAPLGWYFYQHPAAFWSRSNQVFIFSELNPWQVPTDDNLATSLLTSWGRHLRFFIELSTPWTHNESWPAILRWLPLLFWLGLLRTAYLALRRPAYLFLLISFFIGLLPIIFTFPTTLRISPALPATYALLAVGLYYIIDWPGRLLKRVNLNWPAAANVIAALIIFIISLYSAVNLFRFERWVVGLPGTPAEGHWVHLAHLPTLNDHATNLAGQQINQLVLTNKHSVLLPQLFYNNSKIIQFNLYPHFFSPVQADPLPGESVFIIWSPVLGETSGAFLLLSPTASNQTGYVENALQWKQDALPQFNRLIHRQPAIVISDAANRPIGYFVAVDRAQVINLLEVVALPPSPIEP